MKSTIVLFIVCFFVNSASAQRRKINPWPAMFHYPKPSSNSNDSSYKIPDTLKWKFKTNGKIFSSPSIYNGIAFIGSEDGSLYAIDVITGLQRWRFYTKGAVHSSSAIRSGVVYFGSMDGYYYALDYLTGKLKWKFKTGGEKPIGAVAYWGMKPDSMYMDDLWDCFLSSPVVDSVNNNHTVYFGSSDGNMYAVSSNDGKLKWKFATAAGVHTSPTLYNGIIYFGSWDTYFYAVDAATGKEKWKFKTGEAQAMSGIQASAVAQNGTVYFGARDGHLYALNASSGLLVWKYDAQNSWIISSATIANKVLYVGTSDSYLLLSIDAETGLENFRFKTNGYVFGSPSIVGSTIYIGDFTGKMYAIDISSKARRWTSFSTEARKKNAATVLQNDTLDFMYTAKGEDLNYYAANKKVMISFYTLGSIVSSPSVNNNVLYFGSADGYLYAVSLRKVD